LEFGNFVITLIDNATLESFSFIIWTNIEIQSIWDPFKQEKFIAILITDHYRIKRFFNEVHACLSDALTNYKGRLYKVCEYIGTIYTCMNAWKEAFNPYNSSMWIFPYFNFQTDFRLLQSDTIVVSDIAMSQMTTDVFHLL
jgi:hypothetical protein